MGAVGATTALFLVWSLLGLAALTALRANLAELRVALTAPILGTAVAVTPLFALSVLGVSMRHAAPPTFGVLALGSIGVLAWRRPRIPLAVLPAVGAAVLELVLLGRPMLSFGFDWIANANGDMAFYVLAATHLSSSGIQTPADVVALAHNHGFSNAAQALHLKGLRPGAQILLAGLTAVSGQPPVLLYMATILSIAMAGVCATGALAMQAARGRWAAPIAAGLIAISPLAGYGILQELLPQNWGLGLAAGLFAWLMRREVHVARRVMVTDVVVISILATALYIAASEVAASLAGGYVIYLLVLLRRRELSVRALIRVWGPALLLIAALSNTFLPRAIRYLWGILFLVGSIRSFSQATHFAYALVPSALPGAVGLRSLFAPPAHNTSVYIAIAAVLLVIVAVISVTSAVRGGAAACVLVNMFALAALLARADNDFGMFKLYMYAQPFLAVTVAVFLTRQRRRSTAVVAGCLVAAVAVVQIAVLNGYVDNSRNPIDLRNASAPDLLPRFRELVSDRRDARPLMPVTDNFPLTMLEGATAGDHHRLYFVSRNTFDMPWPTRTFVLRNAFRATFRENRDASRLLTRSQCVLALPSGSQVPFNRRVLPEGTSDIVKTPCARARNLLVFIPSSRGQPATLPQNATAVSFWQLEQDPSFRGHTFSGFGRYALFQILGASPKVRVVFTLTTSPAQRNRHLQLLPPAAVVGAGRARFPILGSGSARVVSPPIRPRVIAGRPYIVLDAGRIAELPPVPRPGLSGLWGRNLALDPRHLTAYVRDVSIISGNAFAKLRAPRAVGHIPADLSNPSLEYSGLYEDGWVGRRCYVVLRGGPQDYLAIRAEVPAGLNGQRVTVYVNGRPTAVADAAPGVLSLNVPIPASRSNRDVELRWRLTRKLTAPDQRVAAARLTYIGLPQLPHDVRFPLAPSKDALVSGGVFSDGWIERTSYIVMRGGPPARLVLRAQVPPGVPRQALRVLVNGRSILHRRVGAGPLHLDETLPPSRNERKIVLQWAGVIRLQAPDTRVAAARLEHLALLPRH